MNPHFAHSENDYGRRHLLKEHLGCVSTLAGEFAAGTAWKDEAKLAGLMHDLGKYGDLFQARLRGQEAGLDHWSSGAVAALRAPAWRSLSQCAGVMGVPSGMWQIRKVTLNE